MLEINNLFVRYGSNEVIKNIDLKVEAGEIVSIIGSNGMGKSTLLNSIAGLVQPYKGNIYFEGDNITKCDSSLIVKKGISLSPEDRRIFPYMTVFENLELGAYSHNKPLDDLLKRVYYYFPILQERKNQMGGTLSGGEQQMLTIARALMSNPKLLLLDEASLGLAPLIVEQIYDIIHEIREEGVTVLFVEQNARMALEYSDRTYVLNNGKIEMRGVSAELKHDRKIIETYLGLN